MRHLFLQVGSGILGLWLAIQFITGVEFTGPWKTLVFAGLIFGLANVFIKPILKFITLPIRIITFGLFSLVINMGIVWLVDIFFTELIIVGLLPLLYTTLIIWGLNFLLPKFYPKNRSKPIE